MLSYFEFTHKFTPENGLLTVLRLGLYSIAKEVVNIPAPAAEAPERRVDHSGMENLPSSLGEATPFLEQLDFRPYELVIKGHLLGDKPSETVIAVARERVTSDGQRMPVGDSWQVTREELEEGQKHLCFNSGRLRRRDGNFLERTWTELNLATLEREFEKHGA
jgi:hypothetical protein